MTWQYALAGLFVGVLVGMTGMGGGSLILGGLGYLAKTFMRGTRAAEDFELT